MDKETVLVVHAERTMRNELRSHLEHWGYHVIEADESARARDLFESVSPGLVLLTVHLPDEGSSRLLADFNSRKPDVPVIIVTTSEGLDEALRYLSHGAHEVVMVEPPIRVERLQHIIKLALEFSQLRSRVASMANAPSESPTPGTLASLAHGIPSTGIALFDVEKQLIEQALQATGWNKSKAARLLHITRDTLRYKVKKYHLEDQHTPSHEMPINLAS